ncbi:MAG: cyclomaltodextrinase C-terminal domain-containing protein [Ferruginibacter sp.]
MYYTSEFATTGFTSPNDGYVRKDFPGGWTGDSLNKFELSGRTAKDQEIFTQVQKLANFRKTSSALCYGKMMQFIPEDGIYAYFRYDDKQTIMVVMNTTNSEKTVPASKFADITSNFKTYKNVLTGETGTMAQFKLGAYNSIVLELLK